MDPQFFLAPKEKFMDPQFAPSDADLTTVSITVNCFKISSLKKDKN